MDSMSRVYAHYILPDSPEDARKEVFEALKECNAEYVKRGLLARFLREAREQYDSATPMRKKEAKQQLQETEKEYESFQTESGRSFRGASSHFMLIVTTDGSGAEDDNADQAPNRDRQDMPSEMLSCADNELKAMLLYEDSVTTIRFAILVFFFGEPDDGTGSQMEITSTEELSPALLANVMNYYHLIMEVAYGGKAVLIREDLPSPASGIPFEPKAGEKKSEGCYIATCAYGSYDCPQVMTLRHFRDKFLAKRMMGRAFIRAYYATSPKLVKAFGDNDAFREVSRRLLDAIVLRLSRLGYAKE